MNTNSSTGLMACAVMACCTVAARADEPAPVDASAKEAPGLIEQLDADEFAERREASRRLLQIGKPVVPVLRRALAEPLSAETRWRLKSIILELTQPVLFSIDLEGNLQRIEMKGSTFTVRRVAALGDAFASPHATCGLAWSPSGMLIAAVNNDGVRSTIIYEVSREGRNARHVASIERVQLDGLCFGPDGTLYAVSSLRAPRHHPRREGAGQLLVIDVEDGSCRVACAKIGCGDLDALAIDSAGRALVTIGNQGFYNLELDGDRRVKRSWPLEYGGDYTMVCGDLEGLAFTPRGELYGLLLDDDQEARLVTLTENEVELYDLGPLGFGAKNLACAAEEE